MTNPYFQALGLDYRKSKDRRRAKKALDRAHELRRFEIDNYWKRANYFWLFQAAALTFLGLVMTKTHDVGDPRLLLPAGFGAVSAFAAWLTARGSKFWQQNWESHVDALEEACEGRVNQVIVVHGGLRPSVSRVNETFFLALLIAWLVGFLVVVIWPGLNHEALQTWFEHHRWMSVLVLLLILAGLGFRGRALFSGVSAPSAGGRWRRRSLNGEKNAYILLRDTAFGDAKPPTDE